MKNLIILALLILVTSCAENAGFEIDGSLNSDFEGMAYLKKRVGYSFEILDSAQVMKNKFEFEGTVDVPDLYAISFDGVKKTHHIILDNNEYELIFKDPENLGAISGNVMQGDMLIFNQEMGKLDTREGELIKIIWRDSTTTQEEKDSLYLVLQDVRDRKINLANTYIEDHPDSPHTPDVLNIYIRNFLTNDQLDSVFQTFTEEVKLTNQGTMMGKSIIAVRRSAVGQPMIDFTMPGMNGEEMKLSDLVSKNKLVFIDFWASWCGPCRASIPELKEIYADYHDKGLEFFAVSYDESREDWLKAIDEEELIWPNASYLKGWNCPTAMDYAIRGIPASVLIGQDGIIAARSLRGHELRQKIEELLQ